MEVRPVKSQTGRPMITAYGAGGFRFGETRIEGNCLVLLDEPSSWAAPAPTDLTLDDFIGLLEVRGDRRAQFVLLGTGQRMLAPPAGLRATLSAEGIGLEFMDTAAAARLYNTLTGEGRNFAAALYAV